MPAPCNRRVAMDRNKIRPLLCIVPPTITGDKQARGVRADSEDGSILQVELCGGSGGAFVMDGGVMGKIVDLNSKRPHLSGEAYCRICAHQWAAVAPTGTAFLECPKCSYQYATFKFPIQRDGAHWSCQCGNVLFHIVPEGIYCPFCGSWQSGY